MCFRPLTGIDFNTLGVYEDGRDARGFRPLTGINFNLC